MKPRIIEIDRQEIAPGIFRRTMWSSVPVNRLSHEDTQEFFNRTDETWPRREVVSSSDLIRIQEDKKIRPNHFFESISTPPPNKDNNRIGFSNS